MKIGYFTDVHARTDTPDGRTDDFRTSILTKLEEIGQIFKDVEYVFFGGDMFHTPDPAYSLVNAVSKILISWNKPIYGIIGSHDYFGYQMKSLARTAMGILYTHDVIKLIGGSSLPEYATLEKYVPLFPGSNIAQPEHIIVTGTPHTYWLVDDVKNFYVDRKGPDDILQIQLVHGDLFNKSVPWSHVTCDQIKTSSDLILSGHIHSGWDGIICSMKNGHKISFVNPGSVARLDNTGIQRTPKVCIIETKLNKEFTVDFIPLSSAILHPFREKEEKEGEVQIQDLSRLLRLIDEQSIDCIDVKQQIPIIAKELGMSENVINKSFELVELSGK